MTNSNYDLVPYQSFPYPATHPDHLYTVAKLFSVNATSPKKARVLELGCASGGNIIPMAFKFPESEFVGIDLSKVQIDAGKKNIEEMKLKNLSLQNISIMDIDEKFGKFDYIIAHGIISWVPKQVQDKIFEICSKNLTENGVAYISYNTLPGWNAIKSIREMMLYHTAKFPDAATKAAQAKMLLNFIIDGNGGDNSPYAETVKNEIKTLSRTDDSYLTHDHLEENNEPFYFHEFMKRADGSNLQYLGEAEISTMFTGNFPKETAEVLKQTENDIVRAEQYMDFVRNRRFRSTLLCHKDVKINRHLSPESMKDFYVVSRLKPNKPVAEIDLTAKDAVEFVTENGVNFNTSNRASIAALLYLFEQNEPVAVEDLINIVNAKLGKEANKEVVRKVILENVLRLMLSGAMLLQSFPAFYTTKLSKKPKVSELLRHQATYANWVTNQKSEKVNIDLFNRLLVQYLDGNNDFDAIVDRMVTHVVNDELSMTNEKTGKITDKKVIKQEVEKITKMTIDYFAPNALLVA